MIDALFAIGREGTRETAIEKGHNSISEISDAEVSAAADVIQAKLLEGWELGFRCQLQTNFNRRAIEEMARAVLEAARAD